MLRALILVALICVYCGKLSTTAAETLLVNRIPATTTASNITPSPMSAGADEVINSENNTNQQQRYYHPAEDRKPRILDEFNRNFLDGSYEYKYILSNGVTRYERSYWKPSGKGKSLLARKGFYSYPLTNQKYLTVFYTADENGYQQDTSKFTNALPTLPKHLDILQLEFPRETNSTTTTRKPTTTRKITTHKPNTITTQRPVIMPSKFNWIY